jgi:hypothetical protein
MNKKVVIIVVVILLIAVIGAAIYFATSAATATPVVAPSEKLASTAAASKAPVATTPAFTTVYSKGSYGAVDLGAAETNRLFAMSNVFKRECNGCVGPYTEIYYRRMTPIPSALSVYNLFNEWRSPSNLINVDFKLYSSLSDLLNDRNPWATCNYDDAGIGFPRDCGQTTSTIAGGQWNSLSRGGQPNVKYSVLNSGTASLPSISALASRINLPQYLRHLQNKNFLL